MIITKKCDLLVIQERKNWLSHRNLEGNYVGKYKLRNSTLNHMKIRLSIIWIIGENFGSYKSKMNHIVKSGWKDYWNVGDLLTAEVSSNLSNSMIPWSNVKVGLELSRKLDRIGQWLTWFCDLNYQHKKKTDYYFLWHDTLFNWFQLASRRMNILRFREWVSKTSEIFV